MLVIKITEVLPNTKNKLQVWINPLLGRGANKKSGGPLLATGPVLVPPIHLL